MAATDTMTSVNQMSNMGFDRMISLGELNLRTFERLAARQMDAINLYMEHGTRVMKLATESKGYNEFLTGQAEAAKELAERLMTESTTSLALAKEVRDDYRAWFEKNLAEASADLRKASPAVA